MLSRLLFCIIIFYTINISIFSQDISTENTETDTFIDNFYWYQKYLPQENIAELYVLRDALIGLKANDPDGFSKLSSDTSAHIHDLNNKVIEKLRQEIDRKNVKMNILEWEHGSNMKVRELLGQYEVFVNTIEAGNYPQDDACLDEIERLYALLITRSRYVYQEQPNKIYTVEEGDYLRKIAGKFYNGNEMLWPTIFSANTETEGLFLNPDDPDPDFIYPGATIKIPLQPIQEQSSVIIQPLIVGRKSGVKLINGFITVFV